MITLHDTPLTAAEFDRLVDTTPDCLFSVSCEWGTGWIQDSSGNRTEYWIFDPENTTKVPSRTLFAYTWTALKSGKPETFYHTDNCKFLAVTHNAVDEKETFDRVLAWGTDQHEVIRQAKQALTDPERDRELSVHFRIVEPSVRVENENYKD